MALWPDKAGQESSHPVTFTSPSQIHKAAVSESSSAFGGETGVLGGGQGRAAPCPVVLLYQQCHIHKATVSGEVFWGKVRAAFGGEVFSLGVRPGREEVTGDMRDPGTFIMVGSFVAQ